MQQVNGQNEIKFIFIFMVFTMKLTDVISNKILFENSIDCFLFDYFSLICAIAFSQFSISIYYFSPILYLSFSFCGGAKGGPSNEQ